jgi:hypothetical protein
MIELRCKALSVDTIYTGTPHTGTPLSPQLPLSVEPEKVHVLSPGLLRLPGQWPPLQTCVAAVASMKHGFLCSQISSQGNILYAVSVYTIYYIK